MRKWGDRMKKVEQLAQSFQLNPLTTPYKPRLWPCQPSSIWKLFPRQNMAISFAQSCKEVKKKTRCCIVLLICTREEFLTFVYCVFFSLYMFLPLKKKRRPWVKGSSWLQVTVSCGTITGKHQRYISKRDMTR